MFQVGDRVVTRHYVGNSTPHYSLNGTVIEVNGKWITVQHDRGADLKKAPAVSPRYDYLAEDLQHINPLIRLAHELGLEDD